jgi:hypothetical protein
MADSRLHLPTGRQELKNLKSKISNLKSEYYLVSAMLGLNTDERDD